MNSFGFKPDFENLKRVLLDELVSRIGNLQVNVLEKIIDMDCIGAVWAPTPRKLDGRGEAKLIALACRKPPEGLSHWSLRLLAEELVELGVVDSISYETVRRTLKKTNLNHTCGHAG